MPGAISSITTLKRSQQQNKTKALIIEGFFSFRIGYSAIVNELGKLKRYDLSRSYTPLFVQSTNPTPLRLISRKASAVAETAPRRNIAQNVVPRAAGGGEKKQDGGVHRQLHDWLGEPRCGNVVAAVVPRQQQQQHDDDHGGDTDNGSGHCRQR